MFEAVQRAWFSIKVSSVFAFTFRPSAAHNRILLDLPKFINNQINQVLGFVILEYGDISKIKGMSWYLVELRSEKTIESTMKRVGKALHGIFRSEPIEIFIPVVKRDLDLFEMSTGPYIFVRSTPAGFSSLLRLKQVTGIVSMVTEGESNRPSKVISVEDAYVQTLIAQAEEEHRKRAIGIEVGSFVRILNGETRDFCGVVEIIGDGRAVVRVTLRTKSILLETPIRNLLNISYVPPSERVYYWGLWFMIWRVSRVVCS